MAVILISKTKRMQVFNLDSRAMVMLRSKRKQTQEMHVHRDGGLFPKTVSKRIIDSLTVPAMAKVNKFSDGAFLPDEIVKVPSIAAAILRRELKAVSWDPSRPEQETPRRNAKAPAKKGTAAAAKPKATDKK